MFNLQLDLFDIPPEIWLECAYARAEALDDYWTERDEVHDDAIRYGVCHTLGVVLEEFNVYEMDGYEFIRTATPEPAPFQTDGEYPEEVQEARLLFCLFMMWYSKNPNSDFYFDGNAVMYDQYADAN